MLALTWELGVCFVALFCGTYIIILETLTGYQNATYESFYFEIVSFETSPCFFQK